VHVDASRPVTAADQLAIAEIVGAVRAKLDAEPAPNGPVDLGWNEQSTSRAPVRFPIPPSSPTKPCSTCKAPVHWIDTRSGGRMPVDPGGTSHLATCPQAAQHRRVRAPAGPASRRSPEGMTPSHVARLRELAPALRDRVLERACLLFYGGAAATLAAADAKALAMEVR